LIHGLNPSTWQIYVWDRTTLEVKLVSREAFDPMNPDDLVVCRISSPD